MSLSGFQRRRRELAKQEEQKGQEPKEVIVNPVLDGLTAHQLKDIAKFDGIERFSNMNKSQLIEALEGWVPDGYYSSQEPDRDQD